MSLPRGSADVVARPSTLVFLLDTSGRAKPQSLQLLNKTGPRVQYQVQSTAPEKYIVERRRGTIQPRQLVTVTLSLVNPNQEDENREDSFRILFSTDDKPEYGFVTVSSIVQKASSSSGSRDSGSSSSRGHTAGRPSIEYVSLEDQGSASPTHRAGRAPNGVWSSTQKCSLALCFCLVVLLFLLPPKGSPSVPPKGQEEGLRELLIRYWPDFLRPTPAIYNLGFFLIGCLTMIWFLG